MSIRFVPMPEEVVARLRAGAPDANGQVPERRIATASGLPCRACLTDIAEGEAYLTLAYRPFPAPQPYAEVGPVFLHAQPCTGPAISAALPAMLDNPSYIVRGYGADDRIVYGTGAVVETGEITKAAGELLKDPRVAYLHVRSSANNCYQCRIERA